MYISVIGNCVQAEMEGGGGGFLICSAMGKDTGTKVVTFPKCL